MPDTDPLSDDRLNTIGDAVGSLFPGYFALVMATGIVSIAAHQAGHSGIARVLLVVNVASYAALVLLTLARVAAYFPSIKADLADHARGAGFFTAVAGTCVLGSQWVIVADTVGPARILLAIGVLLWVAVSYGFFTAVTVRVGKPTLESGINGAWLIAIVATQSVALLTAQLAPGLGRGSEPALFGALALHLAGCVLYLPIITLIFYRFTFFRLTMEALTPPYWINMGAVAITTLTGATLIGRTEAWPLLGRLDPFLLGLVLVFWAAATWWIPLLVALGAWRHLVRGYPIRYDPQYWGLVFPLGMYAVATLAVGGLVGLDFIRSVSAVFLWIALGSWLATFAGMIHHILTTLRPE